MKAADPTQYECPKGFTESCWRQPQQYPHPTAFIPVVRVMHRLQYLVWCSFCFVLFWSYQLFDNAAELCECAFPFWFWWHLGRDLRIIHPIICRIAAAASDPRRTLRACQVGNIHNIPQKSKPKNIICYENRKVNIIIYVHHYTYTWQTVQRVEGSSTCVALYRSCTTIKNTHQVKGRLPVVRFFFFFFFKRAAAEEEKANNI